MIRRLISMAVPALLVGAVVVFFVPFGKGFIDRIQQPTVRTILDNRIVQVLTVGAVTLVGMALVGTFAKRLGV